MPDDPHVQTQHLASVLSPAIRAARTPAQMEALASELERIAALTRATAGALRRQEKRPPQERVGPRRKSGGRPSTLWVRVEREAREKAQADTVRVKLSRKLYYEVGRPDRLDVQKIDGRILLIPAQGDLGYKLNVNAGVVAINASGARDLLDGLEGKYSADVRGGSIVVGDALDTSAARRHGHDKVTADQG